MRSIRCILGLMSIMATVTSASSFTKQLGDTGDEERPSVASLAGDIYVSGRWAGLATTDVGGVTLTSSDAGWYDPFVGKMDKDGTVEWATSWGAAGADEDVVIAVDSSGNVGVSGYFKAATMSIAGMSVSGSSTEQYAYVAKLDTSGNAVWTSSFGSATSGDSASGLALTYDSSGNLYVSGYFKGTITPGGASHTSAGGYDGVVIKYSSSGTVNQVFTWGGTGDDANSASQSEVKFDIQVDGDGNVYVLGLSKSTSLTLGSDTFTAASATTDYTVLFKLDSSFSMLWAKQIGGPDSGSKHWPTKLQLDSSGNVYVTGIHKAPSTTIGTTTLTGAGTSIKAGYVASFTSAGAFRWANNLVGTLGNDFKSCTLSNDAYYLHIAGENTAASLIVGDSTLTRQSPRDCMVVTLNAATGAWVSGASFGGGSTDVCTLESIAYPSTDTLVISGMFWGTVSTFRGTSLTTGGDTDLFVEQLDTSVLGIASRAQTGGDSNNQTPSGSSTPSSDEADTLGAGAIVGISSGIAVILTLATFITRTLLRLRGTPAPASELPVVVGQGSGGNVAVQDGASLS